MLDIRRILLPVDFPNTSLRVIHQAATLAHRFHSEIVMLHVMTAQGYPPGAKKDGTDFAARGILWEIIRNAEKKGDPSLGPELADLVIKCMLVEGRVARSIVQTAQQEKTDLIMMRSYGNAFCQFLLGSATMKVLHWAECPVWTDAHVEESRMQEFVIRNILCAIDFTPHNREAASYAVQIAARFDARLTLAHITPGVELWGPGGKYVIPELKEEFVGSASQHMAELQRDLGIEADVYLGSGDLPLGLRQAAEQTKADLLVTGCRPYGLHLRTHGYSIICALPIPVLSV